MRFEARELKPYAEPVTPAQLQIGRVYFSVQFIDHAMMIPTVEPLVYLGRDSEAAGLDSHLFQDAGSYHAGIRIEDARAREATLYSQPSSQLNHIFEYERGLEVLLACSLRRNAHSAA